MAPHFAPDQGGVERYVLRLSRFLVAQGHEVVVHTSRRSQSGARLPERDEVDGVQVRRYPNAFRLGYYWTLFRPRLDSGDVAHLHGYGHLANDWTARKVHGTLPVVYSLHHGLARTEPTKLSALRRRVYDRAVGLRTLSLCHAVICNTPADRDWLADHGLSAVPISVLPTGIEDSAFQPGDPARGREVAGGRRYVRYVGRLHREKRLQDAVDALARIGSEETALVLAGPDAGAREELVAAARRIGVTSRVVFAGEVSEAAKRDLLAGCEVFVLPSHYESQGVVLLEAWAQGRPVGATRVGGVPFVVRDGHDGLLVDVGRPDELASSLRRLLSDAALASSLGNAGREVARREYREEDLFRKVLESYQTLRSGAPRR